MPNPPAGNAVLLVDCDAIAPRSSHLNDAAAAYAATANKLNALQAVAQRHQIPAICSNVRQTTLEVDGDSLPSVQNVLARPVQKIDRHGFPMTDRRGNPELTIDAEAMRAALNMAQQQLSGYAASSGLTQDVQDITRQPLKVEVTRPNGRLR